MVNGRYEVIGSYATAEEAAYSHDEEARRIFGRKAQLNFPDLTVS